MSDTPNHRAAAPLPTPVHTPNETKEENPNPIMEKDSEILTKKKNKE